MPDRIATRSVDSELQRAASLAAARLQSARADLAFDLASVDQQLLARTAAATGGSDGASAAIARLVAANGSPATEVELRERGGLTAADGAVAAAVTVRSAGRATTIVARRPDLERSIVRDAAKQADVGIRLTAPGRPGLAAASASGAAGDAARMAKDARDQVRVLDAERQLAVVASLDGSPVELLTRARGDELRIALVLLLAAGVMSAVAVALIMNRMLRSVAATAERMSSGDFDTRLPVVGVDAGARVAMSLNELASELQDRIGTLERTVERLDRTLEAIDDGVCTWSQDGQLQTWNASAARLTSTSSQDARAGSAVTDALHDELLPGVRRVLLPVGDADQHVAVDLTVRRMRDGGTLQAFRDATPALSIERARTNFLVTAAHELRTPLTTILGFAATIADEELELAPEVRQLAIRQILVESERLDSVVDMFFESSMLARDKIAVSLAHVPVASAIWDAVESMEQRCAVELVGIDAALAVRADREATERIVGELLDNACKYGAAPYTVRADRFGSRVRIHVADAGRGIPLELQEAVFEPFFRLDPEMRSDVGGAGMGLYTARRLAEAMGGTIIIDTTSGDGTIVTVELPVWADVTAAAS